MLNLRPLYGYNQEARLNPYDAYVQQRIKMSREDVHNEKEESEKGNLDNEEETFNNSLDRMKNSADNEKFMELHGYFKKKSKK